MSGGPLVGNDLVWLDDPHNRGRSADGRLLQRILTPAERLLVSVSPEPDEVLWSLWAAKEAAFKAWARSRPGAVFSPAQFEVEFLTREGRARVVRGPWSLAVVWNRGRGWVHALAAEDPRAVLWAVEGAVEGVGSGLDESRAARALALRLALEAGWGPGRVEGRPPVFVGAGPGRPLSLSHDGPWVAAALLLEP